MVEEKSKYTCSKCGNISKSENEYCSKCKAQLKTAKDEIYEESLHKQFLLDGEYGIGFKIVVLSILIIQFLAFTISIAFSSASGANAFILFSLMIYLMFVIIFPIFFKVSVFHKNVIDHPDENIESIRRFIILYFLYITFFPILYFAISTSAQITDAEYANRYTFDYNVFVTFYVIGITNSVLAFAKPAALKFSGRFREASVLNKLSSEQVTSYATKTDYIKIVCAFISIIAFSVVLWKIFMVFDARGFAIFAIISGILLLINLGMFVSNLFNASGNVE